MPTREDYIKTRNKFKLKHTRIDPFIRGPKKEEDFDYLVDYTYDVLTKLKPRTMAKMGQLFHNLMKQNEIEASNRRFESIRMVENVVRKGMMLELSITDIYLLLAPAHTNESVKKFSVEEMKEMILDYHLDTYCADKELQEQFKAYNKGE